MRDLGTSVLNGTSLSNTSGLRELYRRNRNIKRSSIDGKKQGNKAPAHKRINLHMNPQRLWEHAQSLHRSKSDGSQHQEVK